MYVNPSLMDYGLDYATSRPSVSFVVCSSDPEASYVSVQSYQIGIKSALTLSAVQDRSSGGRQIAVSGFTDGTGEAFDTGRYFALVDSANSVVLASGAFSNAVRIGDGVDFIIPDFVIAIPAALTANFSQNILDYGLDYFFDNANALWICSTDPVLSFSAATSARVGAKTLPIVGAIEDYTPGGRMITISAFTDGAGSASGYGRYLVLVAASLSEVLVSAPLGRALITDTGVAFGLNEFGIAIPDSL